MRCQRFGAAQRRDQLANLRAPPQTLTLDAVRNLIHRPRRLRRTAGLRNLVRETKISAHDLILPLFVSEKISKRRPIASMPGVFQFPINGIADEAAKVTDCGLQAIILFGIPANKDEQASGAYADDGVIQQAI